MNRYALLCIAVVSVLAMETRAQVASLRVDSGQIVLFESSSGKKSTITDSTLVSFGDSVSIAGEGRATIQIENNSRILLKGPCTISLKGDGSNVTTIVDDGKIFLDRNDPHTFDTLLFVSHGCTFIPLGTAAAIKTTRTGPPTAAVIKGKVAMRLATGENLVVNAGFSGTLDATGKPVGAKLTQSEMTALEAWSGVKAQPLADDVVPVKAVPVSEPESAPASSQAATAQTPAGAGAGSTSAGSTPPATSSAPTVPSAKDAASGGPSAAAAQTSASSSVASTAAAAPAAQKSGGNGSSKPQFEIGAGSATVDGAQWTRLNFGVDIPIWKFGIFLDLEAFMDNQGQFSNKGWDFRHDWEDAVTRKIRYIRFGEETDPLFVKIGGLSSVTLGYGLIVDRFTNMLHYPDQRLLGAQFNLNDISPIGITLQTMTPDAMEFRDNGGIAAARLAIAPLKSTGIPIVKGITIGGTYAKDFNEYASARGWNLQVPKSLSAYQYLEHLNVDQASARDSAMAWTGGDPLSDSLNYANKLRISRTTKSFELAGGDVGIPIITTSLVSLDLYGQAGIRGDGMHGWGIGAPGVALKIWQLSANVEYREVQGRFTPGYFGPYYFDERLVDSTTAKSDLIPDDTLNGVFGELGLNIANVLNIGGSYQYMIGKSSSEKDQRFELNGALGDMIVQKIPKLNKAEVYLSKTNIGSDGRFDRNGNPEPGETDLFFGLTPDFYYGYRVGFAITQGATLICDSRFGYMVDGSGKLVSNNNVLVQTQVTF